MKKGNYNKISLTIIEESNILNQDDFQLLAELKEELKDTYLHTQLFRTRTEMEISVLNDVKHPTPDSKYWQAMREQNVMFQELVMLSYEYRKNLIEIKKAQRDMEKEKDEFEKELLCIEIERKEFISKNQERTSKDRIREIKEWHEIKQQLLPLLKYGNKDVNSHQLESYTERYKRQAKIIKGSGSIPERQNLFGLLFSALNRTKRLKEEKELKELK